MDPSLGTPDTDHDQQQPIASEYSEEVVIALPGSIVHLINRQQRIELGSGAFKIIRLRQRVEVVAVVAYLTEDIKWRLEKGEAVVKLDRFHYSFGGSLTCENDEDQLKCVLTITVNDSDQLDRVLKECSVFLVMGMDTAAPVEGGGSPEAEATTPLASNVEDSSVSVSWRIASGSGQLIRGLRKWTTTGMLDAVVRISLFFTFLIMYLIRGSKFFGLLHGKLVLPP